MANKRINVYLSDATLKRLDKLDAELCRERGLKTKNNRSAIISEAVAAFVNSRKVTA